MSFAVRDLVMSQRWLPPGEKIVLAALAHWANNDGSSVYPKLKDVSERCGVSVRQIQRCIQKLLAKDVLVVVEKSGSRPGVADHFRIDLDVLVGGGEHMTSCRLSLPDVADGHEENTGQDVTCSSQNRRHFVLEQVTQMSPEHMTLVSPVKENDHSTDHKNDHTTRAREASLGSEGKVSGRQAQTSLLLPIPSPPRNDEAAFAAQVWPEVERVLGFKASMSRHEAFEAWRALGDARPSLGDLVHAFRGYADEQQRENARREADNPCPMQHPKNWIAGRRFEGFLRQPSANLPKVAPSPEAHTLAPDDRARLERGGIKTAEIDAYLADAEFSIAGDTLHVTAATLFKQNWIANHFAARIERAWRPEFGALTVTVHCRATRERAA